MAIEREPWYYYLVAVDEDDGVFSDDPDARDDACLAHIRRLGYNDDADKAVAAGLSYLHRRCTKFDGMIYVVIYGDGYDCFKYRRVLRNAPKAIDSRPSDYYTDRASRGARWRDGKVYAFPPSLRGVSYTWDNDDLLATGVEVDVVAEVLTLHTYAYVGLFKPSVAEVLEQIDEELTREPYFIDTRPAEEKALQNDIIEEWHMGITTVYRRRVPPPPAAAAGAEEGEHTEGK